MFEFFKTAEKLKKIDQATANSFSKVKADINALSAWVSYLFQENHKLQEKVNNLQTLVGSQVLEINDLKVNLKTVPGTPAEIKLAVEKYCDFDHLFKRLRNIEEKIDLLETKHRVPKPIVREVHHIPAASVKPVVSSALKDKLMRRLARSSKDYIKNVIKDLVSKYGRMTALQLRDIVVDEQGLCSKSSFYRVLEEMENERSVAPVHEGKNKIFVPVP